MSQCSLLSRLEFYQFNEPLYQFRKNRLIEVRQDNHKEIVENKVVNHEFSRLQQTLINDDSRALMITLGVERSATAALKRLLLNVQSATL